jgi:hypothetical protein
VDLTVAHLETGMRQPRLRLAGLLALSASVLVYEVGLARLLGLTQFHHFAFLVVSLAVLASAAGGVIETLRRSTTKAWLLALGAAVTIIGALGVLQVFMFDSYGVAWQPAQWLALLLNLLAAAVPFLLTGWAVAHLLAESGAQVHITYGINLMGAALGCVLGLVSHAWGGVVAALALSVGLCLVAAGLWSGGRSSRTAMLAAAAAVLLSMPWSSKAVDIRLSPYKPLSIARLLPDVVERLRLWTAGSQMDVLESESFRSYPGLSLNARGELPLEAALFLDGDGPIPILLACPDSEAARNLAKYLPSAVGHRLRPRAKVLVVEAGGGLEVLAALAAGAEHVTVTGSEPVIAEALRRAYPKETCGLVDREDVTWLPLPPRAALAALPTESFDLVIFALSDPYRPTTAGAYSLQENYLLTQESFEAARRSLKEDGILLVNRWLSTPPADEGRAFALLLATLGEEGGTLDGLVAFRGMRTAALLLKPAGWSEAELTDLKRFMQQSAFDPIRFPGAAEADFNRYNHLPQDSYRDLFARLETQWEATLDTYPFDLSPPDDNRPFFFHFFRWAQLPQVIADLGKTWQPFGGSGFLLMFGLLLGISLLAMLLTCSPYPSGLARGARLGLARSLYFALVGAGFMLVEVPLLQQASLVLVQPAVALALIVCVLLMASGVGSLEAARARLRRTLRVLALLCACVAIGMGAWLSAALGWPTPLRQLALAAPLIPVGVAMGVPLASGLRRVGPGGKGLVAWAWAVNGAASGVAGVVAAIVALEAGLAATILLGAGCYLAASWVAPKQVQG